MNVFQEALLAQLQQAGYKEEIEKDRLMKENINSASIALIGDSNASGFNGDRFWAWSPFLIASNEPELTTGVLMDEQYDVGEGIVLYGYFCQIVLYHDGTATWRAPGDTVGPRTKVDNGPFRQLVFLESGSPKRGVGLYIPQDMISSASPTGTVYDFSIATGFQHYSNNNALVIAQAMTGWKYTITGGYGIGGTGALNLVQRVDDVFYVCQSGKPLAHPPKYVIVSIGANDVLNGTPLQETLDAITLIKERILLHNAIAIFTTVYQEAPNAGDFEYIQAVNNHYYSLAADNTQVEILPFFEVLRDGNYADGRCRDGLVNFVHPTVKGAIELATKAIVPLLNTLENRLDGRATFQFAGAVKNLWPQGMMLGTTGAINGGSGVAAFEWTSTAGVMFSKQAVEGECPWQIISVVDAPAIDWYEGIGESATFEMVISDWAHGETYSLDIEFEITTENGGGLVLAIGPTLEVNNIEPLDGTWEGDLRIENVNGIFEHSLTTVMPALKGVNKTPPITIPSWARTVRITMSTFFNEGSTTLKLRCGGLNKID